MEREGIKRGQIFPSTELVHWTGLELGQAVVVKCKEPKGFEAYGDAQSTRTQEGREVLRLNLAGARQLNGGKALLFVKNSAGALVWGQCALRYVAEPKPSAPMPAWKIKARHQSGLGREV